MSVQEMHQTEKTKNNSDRRLPDFIIIGAMKAGTSTLHHILASHPDVFMPDNEIFFYDMDDFIQHSDFFFETDKKWYFPELDKHLARYMDQYASLFEKAKKSQILGEDSTTYLASRRAPERINRINPKAKLIVMLRDPASRTYSQYWHLLKTGRAIYDFENTLRINPQSVIERSLYQNQIEHFFKFIPKELFCFVIFEEFIHHIKEVMQEICKFLDITYGRIDFERLNIHQNPAMLPRYLKFQIWCNRMMLTRYKQVNAHRLADASITQQILHNRPTIYKRVLNGLHQRINPMKQSMPPAMKESTKKMLNEYFSRENNGLSELINKNLDDFWYQT